MAASRSPAHREPHFAHGNAQEGAARCEINRRAEVDCDSPRTASAGRPGQRQRSGDRSPARSIPFHCLLGPLGRLRAIGPGRSAAQGPAAPLQHIEGCEIASRRLPPSDSDIIEDDTDEQRHQQRATRNKKAHLHSPHSLGVSALLSPSQTRRGHLTATTAAMTATPVPAMRPALWRRPRQPVHGQTSSHRKNRQSSAGPWQPLRQEQPRKERDGACDFSSAGKVPEAPLSATPRLSIRLC